MKKYFYCKKCNIKTNTYENIRLKKLILKVQKEGFERSGKSSIRCKYCKGDMKLIIEK